METTTLEEGNQVTAILGLRKIICFMLIDFLPLIKLVTQFLITPFPSNEGKK